jgi:hypothetical protein
MGITTACRELAKRKTDGLINVVASRIQYQGRAVADGLLGARVD